MPLTTSEFIAILTAEVPEADPTVREHLDDNDAQLLLHLLTADLQRLAFRWFEQDSKEQFERLVGVIERGLREGDEQVSNAMAVSFVEDSGWWDPAMQRFIAAWPRALQEEVENQRAADS
jgi:hypothetical protein